MAAFWDSSFESRGFSANGDGQKHGEYLQLDEQAVEGQFHKPSADKYGLASDLIIGIGSCS
jgi:hypothetical protein